MVSDRKRMCVVVHAQTHLLLIKIQSDGVCCLCTTGQLVMGGLVDASHGVDGYVVKEH